MTDKALYAFRLDGGSVLIQRVDVATIAGLDTDKDGDPVVRSRQSDLTLVAVPNARDALSHLGVLTHGEAAA